MTHIMIDLEALDSKRTAVVVALGAVKFDLKTGALGETFYYEVGKQGMQDQINIGRTTSISTLIWWMQQSDEARKVFGPSLHKVSTTELLSNFSTYCGIDAKVWGNGVDYDNVVIRDLYETTYADYGDDFGLKCPFTYKNNRCYRTFKAMFGHKARLERTGTHHNALDDAITQAEHLIAMHRAVNK